MSLPVITVEQMRRWEAATWETGKTEAEVIAQVGRIVARRALELTQPGDTILLIAGKGHNGDDVRAMTNHLPERDVSLLSIADPAKTLPNLATSLEPRPALVVDGLFGIGLNRVLDADWMQVISQLNANRLRVLSLDVPSGVDAATGVIQGAAIRAEETLTLGAPKTGLLHSAAVDYVGRLTVAPEIGLVPRTATSELQLGQAEDFIGFPPPRPAGGHKSTFGHVGIMAGSLGYHGAAVLAARGATRAQPGLVTLLTPEEVFVPVASQLQSVMVQPLVPGEITIKSITTLLVGPGMASDRLPDDLKTTADSMWHESSVPMVVDASAHDWLMSQSCALASTTIGTDDSCHILSAVVFKSSGSRSEAMPGPTSNVVMDLIVISPGTSGCTITLCNCEATGTNTSSGVSRVTSPGCARVAPRAASTAAPW